MCDYHLSMSHCANGCHPPVLDRVRAVLTHGVPCLCVCSCVGGAGPVCDSVVKWRASLNTDQVVLISLRGGSLANLAVAQQAQYTEVSELHCLPHKAVLDILLCI